MLRDPTISINRNAIAPVRLHHRAPRRVMGCEETACKCVVNNQTLLSKGSGLVADGFVLQEWPVPPGVAQKWLWRS